MNRRKFGLLSASSALALTGNIGDRLLAKAAVPADRAALLKTTLTPMGAERAGSADGLIPAWTGGVTTVPAGWTSNQPMPDIFAEEKPYLTIDTSNISQYSDRLTQGVIALIQKYGLSIDVFPTHRTAAEPQWIYDNIYHNALNAKPDSQGARFGFTGAYGGIPFPIPDTDENGGAEIIWNHLTRWLGVAYNRKISAFVVNGGVPALASTFQVYQNNSFYDPTGSEAAYDGDLDKIRVNFMAPPEADGEDLIELNPTNPLQKPEEIWQLLQGQGRVRKAPELAFDTPATELGGIGNYDEFEGFFGSPVRYEWKNLGKKEIYIPYNNNGQYFASPQELLLPHFVNPAYTRWELHRVWVVDATLVPGERNVIPHRRFYIDEDTWTVATADEWDGQGNMWRVLMTFNELRPELPGLIYGREALYNLQANEYVLSAGPWSDPSLGGPLTTNTNPEQQFNPNSLAAQAQF